MIAGKTGTTEDYGDAWIRGLDEGVHRRGLGRLPRRVQADEDRVPGRAGRGRHYPPAIWKTFMQALLQIDPPQRGAEARQPRRPTPGPAPTRPGHRPRRRAAPRRAGHRRGAAATHGAAPTTAPRRARGPPTDPRRPPRDGARHRTAGRRRPARREPASAAQPGGHGRETLRDPRAQNRHGSSAAFVIPIRGRTARRLPPGGGAPIATGPVARSRALCSSSIPSACVSLPGPEQSRSALEPAPRAHRSMPSSGSSARISTAAPTPSGSQTAFSSAWMP
jgi:hypothetical protein